MSPLLQYYHDYFSDETKDGYRLLCSSVCVNMLNGIYLAFMKEGIEPLEDLSQDKKEKFWEQAIKYYPDTETRIRAAKAGYVLSLITATE